jgi:hypothetical protein
MVDSIMAREKKKHKKLFVSLQMDEPENEYAAKKEKADRELFEFIAIAAARKRYEQSREPVKPPDPVMVQRVCDAILGGERDIDVLQARLKETIEKAKQETLAQRDPLTLQRIANRKAGLARREAQFEEMRARLKRGFQALDETSDEVLFNTPKPLEQFAKVLEAEQDVLQNALESTETELSEIAHAQPVMEEDAALETDTLEPNESAAVPNDLHTQLEQITGDKIPAFNIKTDAEANEKAKAIGAIAFTQGNTIYFQSGKFDPFTLEGMQLLVHELEHVKQQAQGLAPEGIDSSPELEDQAQQKAAQVSSPAKKFSKEELNAFTGQLNALYKQMGRDPERYGTPRR